MRRVLAILVLASLCLPPLAAAAAPGVLQLVQAEDVKPLAQVLRTISARFPGHALDAELVGGRDEPRYRVKWLGEDGKVRDITCDARSGEILQVR